MNDLKTSNNERLVDTRPLFASTWVALFTILRKNYHERHLAVPSNTENLRALEKKRPELSQ